MYMYREQGYLLSPFKNKTINFLRYFNPMHITVDYTQYTSSLAFRHGSMC